MAKIVEEVVVVKLSKLVKDSEADVASLVNNDLLTNLEVLAQELAGQDVIVEVVQA